MYRDPNKGNDLTDQPIAYTDYILGSDVARALICFDTDGNDLHEIIIQGEHCEYIHPRV